MTEKTSKTKGKTDSKIKKFKTEIENLKKDLNEKNDKLLRTIADLQNYQKRMEKEIKNIKEETKRKYLCEIIEIYELLNKAVEDKNPKEGLKLLIKNIEKTFENEKIKCIECIGEKFDHNIHDAVTTIEKKDCEDNTIIEEIKKGYLINDKLLRPSQVIVSKNEDN